MSGGGSDALWTAAEAAAATGGRVDGDWAATSVSIDTRSLAPGALFVALKGDARDGHGFVGDALEKGAAAALVSHPPDGFAAPGRLLMVGDTLEGLRGLAAAARARLAPEARVIGVTGSVGKTGVKEMLRAMLSAQAATHAPEGSFNNHWGVPLTLARSPRDARFLVIEMGMNHAGEIAPLSRLARPEVALITTVTAAHIGNFADEAGVADAKAEIFEGVAAGGVAVLNRDNRWFDRLAGAARAHGLEIVSFGEGEGCDARLVSAQLRGPATVVEARVGGLDLVFKIGAPGRHLALNAVGALAAAQAAGADLARAALALAAWRAPEGRGARWRVHVGPDGDGVIELIDESYNANPASVGAALEVLAAAPVEDGVGRIARGRRIACLGDMMELGEQETALHAGIADHPALGEVDLVFTVGERMRALHAALPKAQAGGWFPDSRAAADRLKRMLDAGDVLMVKGSKTVQMGAVVRAVKALGQARDASAPEET
ncbi:UDP-N-acetylmuramoyl-tripeptide--D-alanyl-D-alanine ligase [Rubrimonas cliftonensis]|uniref:UDP-N-acetylmuramoyl-tripeptide--D-alanyl-D-alanine ligase n=1 Tax=Rubrimonas cliftonensis TaxID=89524 RepID=A0A1H4B6V6_9RHOB|nr:UDP-N-acetylmuramoyl-tripeptide--D-alanyl-D-alanine ligase [Rubrimonas cliftonensis]SEA43995.1 UDP-N-acetylmuramoyl-tripeptide--D-alanyl-D-alanine ligase [Rubrimonas cliftonensis]